MRGYLVSLSFRTLSSGKTSVNDLIQVRTIHISSNGENAPFIEEQFEPYQELNLVSSSQEEPSKPAKTRICVHQDRTLAF